MDATSTLSGDHHRRGGRAARGPGRNRPTRTRDPHHDDGPTNRTGRDLDASLDAPQSNGEPMGVLATVLITDIVNSTEHLVRIGDDAWRLLLAQHDTLIGEELRRNDGRQLCHTGDGVLGTFGRPALAVRCACTIRDNVRHLGLQVRIGIHAGECFIGAEASGIAFHIGARIASLAGPDEVLASRTVPRSSARLRHSLRRPRRTPPQGPSQHLARVRGPQRTAGPANSHAPVNTPRNRVAPLPRPSSTIRVRQVGYRVPARKREQR
jgi:class 3 adenylate cyclase